MKQNWGETILLASPPIKVEGDERTGCWEGGRKGGEKERGRKGRGVREGIMEGEGSKEEKRK